MQIEEVDVLPAEKIHERLAALIEFEGLDGVTGDLAEFILIQDMLGEGTATAMTYTYEDLQDNQVVLKIEQVHQSTIRDNGIGWRLSYDLRLLSATKARHLSSATGVAIQFHTDKSVELDAEEHRVSMFA